MSEHDLSDAAEYHYGAFPPGEPTIRNNRFTHGTNIPAHVAMNMSRKLRDAGLLQHVSPASGRRPAMYTFMPLVEIVRS